MPRLSVERRLAAILSADVVGYSRLMGENETDTLARLNAHRGEFINPTIAEWHGRIVKLMGDGALLEFRSVVDAVECAIAIQRGMSERNADVPDNRRIVLRIGINLGDVIVEGADLHGDGVNVAARIQEIATPGGIALSDGAYRHVEGKVEAVFQSIGEQSLKNIIKPVGVYLWRGDETAPAIRTDPKESVSRLPDQPSIAVLPFLNMSDDSEQELFADGMTEDVITELSRYSGLFVIARNSVFTYKSRAAKAQEIGRDLGVRYIVEGSVRRAGDRVRVTVQLIDSETDRHVWADRYDREYASVFELQDELTRAIVGILPGRILLAEEDRIRRRPPQPMAAYDYVIAGRIHHHRVTPEDNAEALRLLDTAIQLDPDFAEAYAWKACTLGQALQFGFLDDAARIVKEAVALIEKALLLNENDVECHRLLCEVSMEGGQLDKAETHNRRALTMNPNDPRIVAQRGEVLTWLGRAEEGVEWIEKAMRLDPFGAPARAHLLVRALYGARRYAEAIEAFKMITAVSAVKLAEAAACHARIGDEACASELATKVLRLNPGFSVKRFLATRCYQNPADAVHLADGLRLAGLPD